MNLAIFSMLMRQAFNGDRYQTRPMQCHMRLEQEVKMSKERVMILVYANMTGSEKLPLIAIGKFKNPRCF